MQFIAIPRSINGRNRSQAWGLASLFHAEPGHVRSGVPAWLEFREAV